LDFLADKKPDLILKQGRLIYHPAAACGVLNTYSPATAASMPTIRTMTRSSINVKVFCHTRENGYPR
jgi:hypothetical protein